jgi:diketogulonate reductase-like aldo/keto reductase
MKQITLDRFEDLSIPALGLGTWQLIDNCAEIVEHALDVGYRHIDTAQIYKNEEMVGRGMNNSPVDREDIFLVTKVWHTELADGDLQASVDESLRKLDTDYIDLLLIHWPRNDIPLQETMSALAQMADAGKTTHIGVSNFTPYHMAQAMEVSDLPIITNQVEYHPFLNQSEILSICRENDMFLTSYSPIARGNIMDDSLINNLADKYDKSAAQITLRWHIQQDKVCAIPKTSHKDRVTENFDIFDFELTPDEMDQIHTLGTRQNRLVNPDFAPDWGRKAA